jgi:hypothetical protein
MQIVVAILPLVFFFALEAAFNAGADEHSEADLSAGHGISSAWNRLFSELMELRSRV